MIMFFESRKKEIFVYEHKGNLTRLSFFPKDKETLYFLYLLKSVIDKAFLSITGMKNEWLRLKWLNYTMSV